MFDMGILRSCNEQYSFPLPPPVNGMLIWRRVEEMHRRWNVQEQLPIQIRGRTPRPEYLTRIQFHLQWTSHRVIYFGTRDGWSDCRLHFMHAVRFPKENQSTNDSLHSPCGSCDPSLCELLPDESDHNLCHPLHMELPLCLLLRTIVRLHLRCLFRWYQ